MNPLNENIFCIKSFGDIFPEKYDITAYRKMENDHSRKYDIALDLKSLDGLDHQCFYPLTLFLE